MATLPLFIAERRVYFETCLVRQVNAMDRDYVANIIPYTFLIRDHLAHSRNDKMGDYRDS